MYEIENEHEFTNYHYQKITLSYYYNTKLTNLWSHKSSKVSLLECWVFI